MKRSQPPKHLSAAARKLYRDFCEEYGIVDEGGLQVLISGVEAWERARKCREIIDREGMTFTDRWNQSKVHPLCSVERDARAQWLQAVKLLDLDFKE